MSSLTCRPIDVEEIRHSLRQVLSTCAPTAPSATRDSEPQRGEDRPIGRCPATGEGGREPHSRNDEEPRTSRLRMPRLPWITGSAAVIVRIALAER
jgi:hypothetical protein